MTNTVLVNGWATDGSHKDGVTINKSDFNPEIHTLFGEDEGEGFLKRTAAKIKEDLPACTPEELAAFLEEEKAGKNRAGVVADIEKEIAARAQ